MLRKQKSFPLSPPLGRGGLRGGGGLPTTISSVDPHILQYFPIFLAPFFIALHLAALYLADIFELTDVAVARRFVWEVALSGSDDTLRITEGKVAENDLDSPNYLIGGPGKVIVDLDSVALFERADGTPHVIGPTVKELHGKATIDGFERFRQAIDIRDQHVDITVASRSRDGIPITATDVRLVFSIHRGENIKPVPEFPYPFSKESVERIVYKSASRVTPDQPNPSTYEFSWINNMVGLIRGRLGTLLQTSGYASMGFGVAGPLGAKLAAPDRPVVSVCGGGGFVMNASAVLTAVEYDIPVVWLVLNNGGFAVIRDQQLGYLGKGRELATMFKGKAGKPFSADYAAMARSMGAEGSIVEKPADLAGQLEAAIASHRPTVLDVKVDPDIRPLATGSWDLPPLPHPIPDFGWEQD